jgi:hypothetical protein
LRRRDEHGLDYPFDPTGIDSKHMLHSTGIAYAYARRGGVIDSKNMLHSTGIAYAYVRRGGVPFAVLRKYLYVY